MDNKRLLKAILRYDLQSFIFKVFETINPSARLGDTWYISLIADYLQTIVNNDESKRLIINIPPRCLKSLSVSVAWPAWILGLAPQRRIIVASYSQGLSLKHSIDCRALMQSPWYKEMFPAVIISQCHNKKDKFMTTKFGFRMAVSVGGSVTGEGGDILIVDDPHNPTYIHSEKMRNKAIEWFEQTFISRLNNRNHGIIILVMQRLHSNDLAGYLLNKGGWDLLKIPAMSDNAQTFVSPKQMYFLAQGSTIDSERLSVEVLDKMRHEIGDDNFKAQYLQEPNDSSLGMLKAQDIAFYNEIPVFDAVYQSWDTAIKVNDSSDYSVGTTWGVFQSKYYLLDFLSQKLEYSYLKDAICSFAKKWTPRSILIEDKASGQSLIQDLRMHNVHNIVPQKPKIDKITRFAMVLPFFRMQQVLIPQKMLWTKDVVNQLTKFPYVPHDDIVDSISQFLNFMKQESIHYQKPRIRGI